MSNIKKLLELRKKIKRKKPHFIRQDSHKKKKLGNKWRRPKGFHSKMRLRKKGHRKSVTKGYGSPKKVKYLDKKGVKGIVAYNTADIEKIKNKDEAVIIAKNVGLKKRIEISKKAKEKSITILNIKDIDNYLKQVDEMLKKKKEDKQKSAKEKKEKEKEKEKKAKESEKKAEKGKEEDKLAEKIEEEEKTKKEEEKKEKDKTLIQKQ